MRLLITGASGFVGSAILRRAVADGKFALRAAVRREPLNLHTSIEPTYVPDLSPDTEWRLALREVDAIVHTAARVHILRDASQDPLTEFRRVNVDGTLNLARQAVRYGVKRFVFISSIGVNGTASTSAPFTADDTPAPCSPYAVSKLEAEIGLQCIAEKEGLEVVIVRPPLVYGPRAPGNFGTLLKYVRRGIPLPLGNARNLRSFIAIDNLVDLIIRCVDHDRAASQLFLASDGEDLSVADFLRRLAESLDRPARVVPVPTVLLNFLALVLRRQEFAQRLCTPLQVDIAKTRTVLSWCPIVSVNEALKRIADELLVQTSGLAEQHLRAD